MMYYMKSRRIITLVGQSLDGNPHRPEKQKVRLRTTMLSLVASPTPYPVSHLAMLRNQLKMAASLAFTKGDSGPTMPNHEFLLNEFAAHATSSEGVKPFMQHMAQGLHEELARYNWVGFYFMETPASEGLVLGPYVGSFMPLVRIPL